MQSDIQQRPNNYLDSILVDGAKPFRYRSGVRSLLAIPDSEGGNLTFSLNLPPVGFRYLDHPFMGDSYLTQTFPNEPGRHALYTEQEGEPSKTLIKDTARRHAVGPGAGEKQVAVEPTERSKGPSAGIERASIEIPGISEPNQSLPALSQAKQGDAPSPKTEARSQPKPSSGQDFSRKSRPETQEHSSTTTSKPSYSYVSERLAKAELVRERLAVTPSPNRLENAVSGDLRTVGGEVRTGKTSEFSPRIVPLSVGPEERSKSKADQTPGASPSQYVGTDTVNRSNRDAANRIGQLRQALQKLASKVSSLQAGPENEMKEQQRPPPPAQRVVIIKRSSNPPRTPCAFWERSYLGRLLLRTLR